MDRIFFLVSDALSSSLGIALAAALVWGVFSVLLSPCHLGTIPLIVGVVGATGGSGGSGRGRGAQLSFSFAGGMLVAVAVLGAVVATAGYAVQRFSSVTNYVIAAIFVAAGLNLVGILPLPLAGLRIKAGARKGALAAGAIGFIFGIGLSPWVINQSLTPVETADPVLTSRRANEALYIGEVTDRLAARVAMIPWLPNPPVGVAGLRAALRETGQARSAPGA